MGLLRCLSPGPSSTKEAIRNELQQVKAQLAEAKITIADLQQGGGACSDRIGTGVAPTKTSVAVQAKPPVECESRIPRPDETAALKPSGAGAGGIFSPPGVSVNDVAVGTLATAAGSTVPISPKLSAVASSPKGVISSPKGAISSPSRSMFRSRIPASPSPDAMAMRRSVSSRQAPAAAAPTLSTAATATAGTDTSEDNLCDPREPRSQTTSEAGASAAGALAESSNQARADLLANQLRVAEAFRQSLESELRGLRFQNAGLQTQVLTLQTKLERSVEAQVDELDRFEKLRKGAGSADSRGYEEALAQLAVLRRKLEATEADKTVAEQQAKAATELASSHKEVLAATQAEVSSLKADLGAAQAKLLELTAEGARLKQQVIKLGKAQARADELEAALAAAKAAAAAAETDHKDRMSKLDEELSTQKAISESTCEELLALSASHSALKQAYIKMESESKQHDQLVHIVQQELAEMSYFAAAGRVALGLCNPEEAPIVSGAVVVTPTHSGTVPAWPAAAPAASTPAAAVAASSAAASTAKREPGTAASAQDEAVQSDPQLTVNTSSSRRSSRLVEDTTAVCIAAAAAAGAAAAIAANPNSPRAISSPRGAINSPRNAAAAATRLSDVEPRSSSTSRVGTPRRMSRPAAELLACATQAAAPSAAAAREATLTAAGDSTAAEAVEAAVLAAAVAAAKVTIDAGEEAALAAEEGDPSAGDGTAGAGATEASAVGVNSIAEGQEQEGGALTAAPSDAGTAYLTAVNSLSSAMSVSSRISSTE